MKAHIRQIAATIGQSMNGVRSMASKLERHGQIVRLAKGVYGRRN